MKIECFAMSLPNLSGAKEHKHNSWEIILNLSGCGVNCIGGEKSNFYPGTIAVCPPDTYHKKEAIDGFFQDIYVSFYDEHIFGNLKQLSFQDDYDGKVNTLMLMAHNIFNAKSTGYQSVSNSIMEAICSLLLSKDSGGDTYICVHMLKDIIVQNFTNPDFKIKQAIGSINYCDDYIRRCFKKETGITPTEYLNQVRIRYAKKLLTQNASPKPSVTDIAYAAGFYDYGYFFRLFKRMEGEMPSYFA
jgi:AraC-like DNA-binding protein